MNSQRILWEEGMFLTPHHFQQWDRYHEELLCQRLKTLRPMDWGVRDLEINRDALLGGQLVVERCSGILSDGVFFHAPQRDPLPAARSFKKVFDSGEDVLGVHLGIPIVRSGGLKCAAGERNGDIPTPYARRTVTVTDETSGGSEREVATAVNNLRILFSGESFDDFQALKIAEIRITPTGSYELARDYIPPCQYIAVSPVLVDLLRRVTEILSSKSQDLAGQQRKTGGMAEAARFWLLHTVNSHLPALLHCYHQDRIHPEQAFLELSELGAELCSFAEHAHPKDLPIYNHDELSETFRVLDEKLQFLLDRVIPTRCVELPLESEDSSLFSCRIRDGSLMHEAQMYISVGADEREDRLLAEIAAKTKISSREKVQDLIAMAMRGVELRHVATPPAEIPVEPGRLYYRLEKFGAHWEAIEATRTIAIHIPPDFNELRLELLAVKD